MKKALIIVDVQNDFCPGGSLAVSEGDKIVPYLNQLVKEFKERGDVVVYTADWHPQNHVSFKSQGGTWPTHCVQGTSGAELHPNLVVDGELFQKAFTAEQDSYSGFGGLNAQAVGLSEYLKKNNVTEVTVVGLALDYCVKATAMDAMKEGFRTSVDLRGTRAVNVHPEDGTKAEELLKNNNIVVIG